jgi:hypothetical protein
MAVKTFSTGEVLTSGDTNTYLANSGLVYVAGGALSSTTTNFVGCFSATYDNYRIVVSKFNGIGGFIGFRMLTGTTPFTSTVYHNALVGANSLTATTASIDKAITTMGYFGYNFGNFTNGGFGSSYDMINPFGAGRMFFNGGYSSYYDVTPLMNVGSGGGGLDNTASYDGIQILNANGGTLVGNVAIYGYRKA